MTDLFLSSNGYGNDYLKSGLRWSEQPGPPQIPVEQSLNRERVPEVMKARSSDSWLATNPETPGNFQEHHVDPRCVIGAAGLTA